MKKKTKHSAPPPSTAAWLDLNAAARERVIQRLASDAEIREQLANEHPVDAAIYLEQAKPFRAAITALQALLTGDGANTRGRSGR
jgi:hypothetical protein